MKNLLLMFVILLLTGCAGNQEWKNHNTMYANGDHAVFSMFGYKAPISEDIVKTNEQAWWGQEVEYKGPAWIMTIGIDNKTKSTCHTRGKDGIWRNCDIKNDNLWKSVLDNAK